MEYKDGILQTTGEVKDVRIRKDKNGDRKVTITMEFVGSEAEIINEAQKFVNQERLTTIMFTAIKNKDMQV